MARASIEKKSFLIPRSEMDVARWCAKEQGVSLNKYLCLAVLEKNRGVVQGLESSVALKNIQATVRESEARNALALESTLADMRAEQSAALQANEDLVVKTLQAFSQFLAQAEPDTQAPAKQSASMPARNPSSAFLPPKP